MTHLGASIPLADEPSSQTIPEPDLLIRSSSSTRQNTSLMRTPSDRLDRSAMLPKSPRRPRICSSPDKQLVIVPTTCQLVRICVPSQTANLLLVVSGETADVLVRYSRVAVEDGSISGAGGENMIVPCETADSAGVTAHRPYPLAVFRVPDLYRTSVCPDCERASLSHLSTCSPQMCRVPRLTLFVHSKPVMTSLMSPPPAVVAIVSHNLVTLLVCALQR